jgi:hypothetical protein
MVVMPTMDVVRRGVLIKSTTKLGNGLSGVLAKRNLSQSLALPTIITLVVRTPQMVFTNSIITTHVNMIIDRPSMNSMVVRGYKNVNVTNLRGGY